MPQKTFPDVRALADEAAVSPATFLLALSEPLKVLRESRLRSRIAAVLIKHGYALPPAVARYAPEPEALSSIPTPMT